MSSYSDFANNVSRIYEQRGAIKAEQARQRGAIWGQAIQNLGQIPAQIQAGQDAAQQRQVRNLQMQVTQGQLQEQQRNQAAQDAIGRAVSADGVVRPDGSVDYDKLRASVANTPAAAKFPELQQHFMAADEARAKLQKSKLDTASAEAEYMGSLAAGADVLENPHDKAGALLTGIVGGMQDGSIPKDHGQRTIAGLLGPDGQPDPAAVSATIQQMLRASKTQQELIDKRNTAQKQQGFTLTPGEVRYDAQGNILATGPDKPAGAEPVVTVRTMENGKPVEKILPRSQATGQTFPSQPPASVIYPKPEGPAAGQLSPEGIEYAATQYRVTGVMPAMGMGRTPERFAVINKAAEQAKLLGQTPAAAIQKQAAFKADANALKQMETLSAGATAAENKAIGQIQLIRDLSAKVPRTQIPLINSALQAGRVNLLGNSDAQQLANAIQTFSQEYGKIIEGSTASVAGSSDSSRAAAGKLVNASMNPKTLNDVLALMQKEMDLTLGGYEASVNHITGKMGGQVPSGATAPTPGVAPVGRYNPATGKVEPIR